MFSDIIKSEGSPFADNKNFYKQCLDCEVLVTTKPDDAVRSLRYCIELFADEVLSLNGIKIPEDRFEREQFGLNTIEKKLIYCVEHKFFKKHIEVKLQNTRRKTNKKCHPSKEVTYASELFREFYVALVSYITDKRCEAISEKERIIGRREPNGFVVKARDGYDAEDLLPIGKYEIIDPLFDCNAKNITKSFRAKKTSTLEGRTFTQYAIIKKFIKDSPDDITQNRDSMAMTLIKSKANGIDNLPILTEDIDTGTQYQYSYLVYLTAENTFLLTDAPKRKEFFRVQEGDKHSTVYKRLKVLKEITEVLYSLSDIDGNLSIHHRNLRPDCVFITPTKRGGKATLGNFEYSKIIDDSADDKNKLTLNMQAYAKKVKDDPFAPPEVKTVSPLLFNKPDWEQVDIYSLAMLSLYLLFGEKFADKIPMHLNTLRENVSEELYNITKDIIESPYGSRPTLEKYLDVIEDTLSNTD